MITLDQIEQKVIAGERITEQDALFLFRHPDLIRIGKIANLVSEKKNGDRIFIAYILVENFSTTTRH